MIQTDENLAQSVIVQIVGFFFFFICCHQFTPPFTTRCISLTSLSPYFGSYHSLVFWGWWFKNIPLPDPSLNFQPVVLPRCSRRLGLSNHRGVSQLDAGAPPDRWPAGNRVTKTWGCCWDPVPWWARDGAMSWTHHKPNERKVSEAALMFYLLLTLMCCSFFYALNSLLVCFVYSLLPGLDWIERENFLDVHLTRNRPPPARRRRLGPTQRTSFRRAGQSLYTETRARQTRKTCFKSQFVLEIH